MKEDLLEKVELPAGVSASMRNQQLCITGPKGEVCKDLGHPRVVLTPGASEITLTSAKATKREKTIIKSLVAHLHNMIAGVQEPFVYKLKICSGHFPMGVTIKGDVFTIKNFLGESVPRTVTLLAGTTVKIDGKDITITSLDKELAGHNAAKIEQLCRITKRDRRIFQDGCYITEKAGKVL